MSKQRLYSIQILAELAEGVETAPLSGAVLATIEEIIVEAGLDPKIARCDAREDSINYHASVVRLKTTEGSIDVSIQDLVKAWSEAHSVEVTL